MFFSARKKLFVTYVLEDTTARLNSENISNREIKYLFPYLKDFFAISLVTPDGYFYDMKIKNEKLYLLCNNLQVISLTDFFFILGNQNNEDLLTRPKIRKRLETAVEYWVANGRREKGLLEDMDYLKIYCWLHSRSGKMYRKDDAEALLKASHAAFGKTGYAGLLRQREPCSMRETSIKIENILVCTDCDKMYCHYCCRDLECNSNSEALCSYCGGVIVG